MFQASSFRNASGLYCSEQARTFFVQRELSWNFEDVLQDEHLQVKYFCLLIYLEDFRRSSKEHLLHELYTSLFKLIIYLNRTSRNYRYIVKKNIPDVQTKDEQTRC